MVSEDVLSAAVNRLVAAAKPTKVILFGSYATGKATEDSDLDIIIIEPATGQTVLDRVTFRDVVGDVGAGVDVLVFSEQEVDRRGQVPGTVIYWALKEGRVVYEAPPR